MHLEGCTVFIEKHPRPGGPGSKQTCVIRGSTVIRLCPARSSVGGTASLRAPQRKLATCGQAQSPLSPYLCVAYKLNKG